MTTTDKNLHKKSSSHSDSKELENPFDAIPTGIEFTPDDLENGRKLFTQQCTFMLGVANMNQVPVLDFPEVAFAGRSNVGKSSLINTLTGHKALARTSNTPGRTRELNYFNLGNHVAIVDMPGYGYARASKDDIKRWNANIKKYLLGRRNLRRVFILVDSRHGLKPSDLEMMDMLDEAGVPYQIILTKCDKLTQKMRADLEGKIQSAIKKRAAASPFIFSTSSAKNIGLEHVRAFIYNTIQG